MTAMSILRTSIRRLKRLVRGLRPRRNHVFRHDGPFPLERHAQAEFHMCCDAASLPDSLRRQLAEGGTERMLETDLNELRSGAKLWYALIDGRLAAVLFTRSGHQFRNWFVPLRESDLVIFRVRTYSAYRGRGLAPSMMRWAMHKSLRAGDSALIDCRTDNHPSIRSIEKAGFHRVATMKPITRAFAFGPDESSQSDVRPVAAPGL